MLNPWRKKKAVELIHGTGSTHLCLNALSVAEHVGNCDQRVDSAVLGEQLATTSAEGQEVWVGRIHDPTVFSHRLGEQSCEI